MIKPPPFHHRPVNDLHWLLFNEPLMRLPQQSANRIAANDDSVYTWLQQLDQQPASLVDYLAQRHSTRLGIYCETLLGFYFLHSTRYRLLAKNQQITNNKSTLGELDFLIQDTETEKIYHWEVALKFYLGEWIYQGKKTNPELNNWHQWVGPGQQDTLAIKLQRVKEHQLPLAQNLHTQRTLKAIVGEQPINSEFLLWGRLFYPQHKAIDSPMQSNQEATQHFWVDDQHLHTLSLSDHYCIIPRQYWISELTADEIAALTPKNHEALINDIQKTSKEIREWKIAVVRKTNNTWEEYRRGFIVKNAK